jgi:hypothetical protein
VGLRSGGIKDGEGVAGDGKVVVVYPEGFFFIFLLFYLLF